METASYRVWVRDGLVYHPVRKAASSSFQYAFGGEPVDMRRVVEGILHFTLVRNPFDRLASLYANNLDYHPFAEHGIYKGMGLKDFVDCVCATREPLCDHHFWEANRTTPRDAEVFYFEDIDNELVRLNYMFGLSLKVGHIGLTEKPKPHFSRLQVNKIADRYYRDLERFYENNFDPEGCRIAGQAKAKFRQSEVNGPPGFDCFRDWLAPADSPTERRADLGSRREKTSRS